MDIEAVRQAVAIDPARQDSLQHRWMALMDTSLWGRVKSSRLGAISRLRRRVLEVGEKLVSLCAVRDWIPHPREQLKNALGSSLALKDALAQLHRAAGDIDGGEDAGHFSTQLAALEQELAAWLPELENRWATLLDTQYEESEDDDAS